MRSPRSKAGATALASVLPAVIAWVILLRRQVAAQAGRLAGEMQKRRDAALEYQASLRAAHAARVRQGPPIESGVARSAHFF